MNTLAATPELKPRCFRCFRPARLCYCDSIPTVSNRTSLLILQHRRERSHPFNTARIVSRALDRCQLITANNADLSERFDATTLAPKAGILYPGNQAQLLTSLSEKELPQQLVILDGTWHHAKTLFRDIPRLRTLPRFRLAPSSPGRYRIRREPNAHALSTLEATVAALRAIEPDTHGLDDLLRVFDRMITDQLDRGEPVLRTNRRRRSGGTNLPRALAGDPSKIVVAYGERERGGERLETENPRVLKPKPIYWTAVRLSGEQTFECAIESDSFQDDSFLQHLRLSREQLQTPLPIDTFRDRWRDFLRPDDHLAVYHPNTARLLENVDAKFVPAMILKAINRSTLPATRGQEVSLAATRTTSASPSPDPHASRASQRLASAVEMVLRLRLLHGGNE